MLRNIFANFLPSTIEKNNVGKTKKEAPRFQTFPGRETLWDKNSEKQRKARTNLKSPVFSSVFYGLVRPDIPGIWVFCSPGDKINEKIRFFFWGGAGLSDMRIEIT